MHIFLGIPARYLCITFISIVYRMVKYIRWVKRKLAANNLPGNFLVRNDAFVIIDLEMETVDGVMATLMPMGPSHGCPEMKHTSN